MSRKSPTNSESALSAEADLQARRADDAREELETWRRVSREIDAQHLYEQVEQAILTSPRTLTRRQVAEQAGVPLERAVRLWRALGFPGADDDEALFVEADVVALRLVTWLVENGYIDEAAETALVRSMGRTYARLAEWEVSELATAVLGRVEETETDQDKLEELVVSLVPVIEDIQNYVWRRHVAGAAGRLLLRPEGGGSHTAVGFADIVGYTRQSRSVGPDQLARMLDTLRGDRHHHRQRPRRTHHQDDRRRDPLRRRRPAEHGPDRARPRRGA